MISFKQGKDVCLLSNGRRMTMIKQTPDGKIVCMFINDHGKQVKEAFEPEKLQPAKKIKIIPYKILD